MLKKLVYLYMRIIIPNYTMEKKEKHFFLTKNRVSVVFGCYHGLSRGVVSLHKMIAN